MAVRRSIRFLRRGKVVQLTDVPPMATLRDSLGLEEGAFGPGTDRCRTDGGHHHQEGDVAEHATRSQA